jgi:hypothetical protein
VSAVAQKATWSERYGDLVESWKTDYYAFARDVLGITYYTPDQHRLIDSYMTNRYTACTSGHGTGKTHALAGIVIHFAATNEDSLVVTTSASWELLTDALWPEIRAIYQKARIPLGGELLDMSPKFDEQWMVIAVSTKSPTNFHGKHAPRVLVVIDEAEGAPDFVFVESEAMAIGPNDRIVATANPTDATSAYRQECLKTRADGKPKWNRVIISCLNHPNVVTGENVVPGAVTRTMVDQYRHDYGEDHPEYIARVLGDWSLTMGRMFPDWNVNRHTYNPSEVPLQPWYPRWISADWGFSHPSAVLFYAYDGAVTYVYDEIVQAGLVAAELGERVGKRANPQIGRGVQQRFDAVYLAHDAFGHMGETGRTRAELFSDAIAQWGLPMARRASVDRIGGFNLITALLRNDALKVSKACPQLIARMPLVMRDPKKTEDAQKIEGDDLEDSLYKGIIARPAPIDLPREVVRAAALTAKTPHDLAMQSRILDAQEKAAGNGGDYVMRGRRYGNGG